MKIITVNQMRQVEEECASIDLPPDKLMENAGKAVAEEARKSLGDLHDQQVLCLVGAYLAGALALVL